MQGLNTRTAMYSSVFGCVLFDQWIETYVKIIVNYNGPITNNENMHV